jgi:hypothetical protein
VACKKCGNKAAKTAFVPPTPTTYSFDVTYPVYGAVETTPIAAREELAVILLGSSLRLAAGQLMVVPNVIVDLLVGAGAPIWIF